MNLLIILLILFVLFLLIFILVLKIIRRIIKVVFILTIIFIILLMIFHPLSILDTVKNNKMTGFVTAVVDTIKSIFPNIESKKESIKETFTEFVTKKVNEDFVYIKTYFCPYDDCIAAITDEIDNSESSVYCAFFDLDNKNIINSLNNIKDLKLIVDNNHYDELVNKIGSNTSLFSDRGYTKSSSYMHNKFCIIDNETLITGSANPTDNGLKKNDNNIIIIKHSKQLINNYYQEFKEMLDGDFHAGKKTEITIINFKHANINSIEEKNITIKTYFCPEDNCRDKILKEINKAKQSIYFLLFSFTDDYIGDALITKYNNGLDVKGILEKRNNKNNKYSEYEKLIDNGIEILLDSNPFSMHNKIFIIDNNITITGSYNPTNNANYNNDENILIIYSKKLNSYYKEYFNKIYNKTLV